MAIIIFQLIPGKRWVNKHPAVKIQSTIFKIRLDGKKLAEAPHHGGERAPLDAYQGILEQTTAKIGERDEI